MTAEWVYESSPGTWTEVKDKQIEARYQQWKKDGKETGIVYHCFGNEMSTGVSFQTMQTHCLSAHKSTRLICNCPNGNEFNLKRLV